jgi:hypothetical protein
LKLFCNFFSRKRFGSQLIEEAAGFGSHGIRFACSPLTCQGIGTGVWVRTMFTATPPMHHSRHPESRSGASDVCRTLRTVRPSLLDLRFSGDAWLVEQTDGLAALCLGGYRLVHVQTLDVDLPTLNVLLDRARRLRPRWQKVTNCYRPPRRNTRAHAVT